MVDDQTPIFEELENECERLYPVWQTRAAAYDQAIKDNKHMEKRLAYFVLKFRGHVGLA